MPRTPIYPEVENFIILKKRAKLEKVKADSKKESSTTQTLKRKCSTTTKRKDAPTSAKRSRQANISATSSSKKLLKIKLGTTYQRYTLSTPFDTFCNNTLNKASSLEKVKEISGFIREALGSSDKERPADQNLDVVLLASSFVELSATMNGSLFVPKNGLKNYGQSLSAACETVATTYNNYYTENFENIICNYFIYALRIKFPNAKVGCIKNLVYNHVYDQVLTHPQLSSIPVDILALFDPDVGNNLTSFLNPLILEVKNRISTLPQSKESLNKEPFKILPTLRHILEKYDDIYKAQATQKDKTDFMKSVLPRRFSLFPNPTLHWRFVKIDAQNLTGIFPDAKQKKQANESSFDHQQRCFYQMFAFKRLYIQSCEKLQALPEQKGKMFLDGLYTDGYTCRVLFARKVLPSPPEYNICLELNDLSSEEVNKHFRPCTVDPGRRDPFVSYHGGTDMRRWSSIEYYDMGGSVTLIKEQQKHKHRLDIEKIETNIPSPKTVSMEQFVLYITYMSQHMNTLFDFYSFETSKVKWLNYLSSQKSIQESVNILINGGKKPRTTLEERALTTIPKSKRSATVVSKTIWKISKLDKMTMEKRSTKY
ncbi:hypothetical protein MFLAVUS_001883 [Mucor flavus]|uniref:Uncharacterized protein n=1 Tax=Mucor flavus TaxID=439312 RepID=A0ABP9YNS3_9FUNG